MISALANAAWWTANLPAALAFERALQNPREAQTNILQRYLRENADTAFGREHGFSEIRSPAEYQRRVPVRTFDDFSPWIDRIAKGELAVLTSQRVVRFATSSGSTSAAKRIPYTRGLQREFSRAVAPWIFDLYRNDPALSCGPAYWSISPAIKAQDFAPTAIPVGFEDDSEYLGGLFRHLVEAVMAVPGAVRHLACIDDFRYVTLLYLLRRRDLRLISVWHPSFLSVLLDALPALWAQLLSDIKAGGCAVRVNGPWNTLRPLPARHDELARASPADPASFWPQLRLISCWTDSHSQAPAAALAARLPHMTLQPKGLLATEGIVSLPFAGTHPLAIQSHFFEFLDDRGDAHLAHELQPGSTYSVLLTTAGGLYRYRLHDRVIVTGKVAATPAVRFVCKEDNVSDLVGEKLSDGFVLDVLQEFRSQLPAPFRFALLAPHRTDGTPGYMLHVEYAGPWPPHPHELLDSLLCRNPHYRLARDLGQLRPVEIFLVQGDGYSQFTARYLALGQKLGDIKPCSLSRHPGWRESFRGLPLTEAAMACSLDAVSSGE